MSMEQEQYVRREVRRDDARCVGVYLTRKGRAAFEALDILVRHREERLLIGFSARERAAAFVLIRRLARNMSANKVSPGRGVRATT
jgi:DNA-binding MarR family transcriptional regulator